VSDGDAAEPAAGQQQRARPAAPDETARRVSASPRPASIDVATTPEGHAMRRRLIAFDLDGTLATSKSPIDDLMATRLKDLLGLYDVCVISGGDFPQFDLQLVNRLHVSPTALAKLHLMPTCGTRYYRFDISTHAWTRQYSEDLTAEQRSRIIGVLTAGAKELGFWEPTHYGQIIEDRGSQITFSALGQNAPPALKYAWDPDGNKKDALRRYAETRLPEQVHIGGTTSIDVTNVGVDKAYGIRRLLNVLDLAMADVLFLGDKLDEGGNDFPVKAMGIDTIAVDSWQSCALAIEAIVAVTASSTIDPHA
jgi:phosphomannomutase